MPARLWHGGAASTLAVNHTGSVARKYGAVRRAVAGSGGGVEGCVIGSVLNVFNVSRVRHVAMNRRSRRWPECRDASPNVRRNGKMRCRTFRELVQPRSLVRRVFRTTVSSLEEEWLQKLKAQELPWH